MTKGKVQSVLPFEEDEELEPIIFNVTAQYNPRVKVHNWQLHTMQEPKDNANFLPPQGNLHLAHYQRFGPDTDNMWLTETQAMLNQINLREQYKPIYPKRNLLNMQSFAMVESEEQEEEEGRLQDLLLNREEPPDYKTTTEIDYKLHFPLKSRPPPPPPPIDPWLLHRKTIGYHPESLENREGYNTFLDDNLCAHQRIAELKQQRDRIYELSAKDLLKDPQEMLLNVGKKIQDSPCLKLRRPIEENPLDHHAPSPPPPPSALKLANDELRTSGNHDEERNPEDSSSPKDSPMENRKILEVEACL